MGIEGDENDCLQWRIKGVRGRAETRSLRKYLQIQRKATMFQSGTEKEKCGTHFSQVKSLRCSVFRESADVLF